MEYKFPTLDKEIENWYRKCNLLKTSYFIICEKPKDNNIILTSKFGGRIPLLKSSKKEIPKCKTCKRIFRIIGTIIYSSITNKKIFS